MFCGSFKTFTAEARRRGEKRKPKPFRRRLRRKAQIEESENFAGGLTQINADQDRGDILRPMNRRHPRQQSGVAKAPAILFLLAVAIFAVGAVRYYRHGNFTLMQAGYCLIAILASLVVLLVFDYTLHHAKVVAVMVLVFVVLFLVASPAFCVGMGLGLAGMVVVQGRG